MSDKNEVTSDIEKFQKCEVLEEEYIVEKILDKKKINGSWKYKVKWEGYSEEECTWEPRENLRNVKYLVDEFEGKYSDKTKNKSEKGNFLQNKRIRNSNIDGKDEEKSNSVHSYEKRGANGATIINNASNARENKETAQDNINQIEEEEEEEGQASTYKIINTQNIGSLETDTPLKIINAKILDDQDVHINCLVKWKPRIDGFVPESEWISSKLLKVKFPSVLFDFYESRIKFPKKESK